MISCRMFVEATPTNQDWDDWPLRMTFRINSFIRADRDNFEPDLAILNAFEATIAYYDITRNG